MATRKMTTRGALGGASRPALLSRRAGVATTTVRRGKAVCVARAKASFDREEEKKPAPALPLPASLALFPYALLANAPDALAKGGELGILEGRTIALIHPAMMFALLGVTGYLGYSGLAWRQVRTLGDDIAELKKEIKAKAPAKKELVAAGAGDAGDAAASAPAAASPAVLALEAQVESLQQKRKDLIDGKFRDKHNTMGALLLAAGVTTSVEGCLNTFSRTGKLFPGPHLWAGAAITCAWAIAASLVPAMQKGNDAARSAHIALNTVVFGLFLWQVPTGWAIVEKVFQFTSWP